MVHVTKYQLNLKPERVMDLYTWKKLDIFAPIVPYDNKRSKNVRFFKVCLDKSIDLIKSDNCM